jgi:hypothetical protein
MASHETAWSRVRLRFSDRYQRGPGAAQALVVPMIPDNLSDLKEVMKSREVSYPGPPASSVNFAIRVSRSDRQYSPPQDGNRMLALTHWNSTMLVIIICFVIGFFIYNAMKNR